MPPAAGERRDGAGAQGETVARRDGDRGQEAVARSPELEKAGKTKDAGKVEKVIATLGETPSAKLARPLASGTGRVCRCSSTARR